MTKKSIFVSIFIIIFSVIFWYSLVYWVDDFFEEKIYIDFKLSNNIFPDSLYLRKTKIIFYSDLDLSNYKVEWNCNVFSKFISKKEDIYSFDLTFLNDSCKEKDLFLKNVENQKVLKIDFNFFSEFSLYSKLINYKTEELQNIFEKLDKEKKEFLKYNKFDKNWEIHYYEFLKKNRYLNEVIYNQNLIKSIINSRNKKYLIPVKWKKIPTRSAKLPNSRRPYRAWYTDWIHHWWDFDWDFWEQVLSIDDWIIVRVVPDFVFSNLDKIKKTKNLTEIEELKNLDILRWKQVWLKTMKWDVAFYSHLNDIFSNIKEWTIVRKWQPIWTIWITWVPDKNYTDYHLHLPVHKNPFLKKSWKYDIEDYMKWSWYFKGKDIKFILKNQWKIFKE